MKKKKASLTVYLFDSDVANLTRYLEALYWCWWCGGWCCWSGCPWWRLAWMLDGGPEAEDEADDAAPGSLLSPLLTRRPRMWCAGCPCGFWWR